MNTNTETKDSQRLSDLKPLLYLRRALGFFSKILSHGYSSCFRCGITWKFTEGHSTPYTEQSGCFPLCEHCWNALTPKQRLPYYERLFNEWKIYGEQPDEWTNIKTAVLEGK